MVRDQDNHYALACCDLGTQDCTYVVRVQHSLPQNGGGDQATVAIDVCGAQLARFKRHPAEATVGLGQLACKQTI